MCFLIKRKAYTLFHLSKIAQLPALSSVSQLVGHHTADRKFSSLIAGQGTRLG